LARSQKISAEEMAAQARRAERVQPIDRDTGDLFAAPPEARQPEPTETERPRIGERRAVYTQDITQTPEFRRWIRNSKVVDEQGRALVVYRGTQGDFAAFDPGGVGSFTRAIETRQGTAFFFTDLPSFASEFAVAGSVMPVYLSLQNPLVV